MDNQFVNVRGKKFHSSANMVGSVYAKKVTEFVHRYDGFALDIRVFEQLKAEGKEGIEFNVLNNLYNYKKMNSKGHYPIVCNSGKYFITVEDAEKFGTIDTLNRNAGKQLFVPAFRCTKAG
jgi:hypothetical protein